MSQTVIDDATLKARHRAMWALGDYPAVATEVIAELGPTLVEAVGVRAGERLLDVAAGSGNVALPAARAGARVTASDLTPELLESGRRAADAAGLDIAWETGDAEALPYADHSFDVTTSWSGVMFAPHHQAAADELVRVTRPGGRLGLISWTPGGVHRPDVRDHEAVRAAPAARRIAGAVVGRPDHVRDAARRPGDRESGDERGLRVTHFATAEEFRDYFKINYGPTIAVYRSLAEQPERQADLDQDLAELGRRFAEGAAAGRWSGSTC